MEEITKGQPEEGIEMDSDEFALGARLPRYARQVGV